MCAMSPRLLRPRAAFHPEAANWATRVQDNGGTVSGSTLNAVSRFCRAIDAAKIRSKFLRLNLFCGDNILAALVPLYLAESRTATVRGNTTDTNTGAGPFDSTNYNNTGSASGLKGNGTSTFLITGVPGNSSAANNTHLGVGLRATESRSARFSTAIGVNSGGNSLELVTHSATDQNKSANFTRAGTASDGCGDSVGPSHGPLAVGDIVAAWPSMYRNGIATGSTATTSQDFPNDRPICIFATGTGGTSAVVLTDARINWYSIGLTMTAAEVLSFYNAIAAFNTSLNRT